MPFPSLTFENLLSSATRTELEQLVSLFVGYLSAQHSETGAHTDVTLDTLTVADEGEAAPGAITGDLSPSANDTYDLGRKAAGALTAPYYAWRTLYLTNGIQWAGDATSGAAGTHVPSWQDALDASTGNRTSTANIANTQTWIVSTFGTDVITIGGLTTVASSIAQGVTIPRLLVSSRFDATNGLHERGRVVRVGEWSSVTYAAGNFTASSGTWTVDSGDQLTYAYTLVGKTMTLSWAIQTTDVSAGAVLRLAIPGSNTAAQTMYGIHRATDAGGTPVAALCRVLASGTYVELYADMNAGNWTITAADNTTTQGQITFEIS